MKSCCRTIEAVAHIHNMQCEIIENVQYIPNVFIRTLWGMLQINEQDWLIAELES